MVEQRLSPEYVDSRGKSWVAPSKAKLAGLTMNLLRYGHKDCEIIVPTVTMESGGKVSKRVCESIGKFLRKKIRQGHTTCLQCLNYPTPAETSRMLIMMGHKTGRDGPIRAGLETFGLVHEHKSVTISTSRVRCQNVPKKRAPKIHMVTPADHAGAAVAL